MRLENCGALLTATAVSYCYKSCNLGDDVRMRGYPAVIQALTAELDFAPLQSYLLSLRHNRQVISEDFFHWSRKLLFNVGHSSPSSCLGA